MSLLSFNLDDAYSTDVEKEISPITEPTTDVEESDVSHVHNTPIPTKEEGANDVPFTPTTTDEDPPTTRNTNITIDIDTNRDKRRVEELRRKRNLILTKITTIDRITYNYATGVLSQEGFTDAITNAGTGILNIVGHMTNLLATAILYGLREFKRSELTEYSDSNRATMSRLYSADYRRMTGLTVPVPQGMVGQYAPAMKVLVDFFKTSDMLKKSKIMYNTIKDIRSDIYKNRTNFESYVRDAHRTFNTTDTYKAFTDTTRIFTTRNDSDNKEFCKMFNDMGEYEYCCKTGMDMDSELRQVASVYSYMRDSEREVDLIIKKADKLDESQVKGIAQVVRSVAEITDMYGTCANDLRRMTNNLLWVTKRMRSHLNY